MVDDASPLPSLGTAASETNAIRNSAAMSNIDISTPGSNTRNACDPTPQPLMDPIPTATTPNSKLGTESIAYLKLFISPALQNIRDLKLADRWNALADNLDNYLQRVRRELDPRTEERMRRRQSEQVAAMDDVSGLPGAVISEGKRSNSEMEEECQKLKVQADDACRQVGEMYDALVRFVQTIPHGTNEDFVQFLLLESTAENVSADGGAELMEENFYANDSEYRKLWNDNLTLGLGEDCTTLDRRVFVPENDVNNDPLQDIGQELQSIWYQHIFESALTFG